jgi:hypothetical protein
MLHAWSHLDRMTCLLLLATQPVMICLVLPASARCATQQELFLRLHVAALWNEMRCGGLLLELTVLLIEWRPGHAALFFQS